MSALTVRVLAAFLLAAVALPLGAAEKVGLRWQFKQGEKLGYLLKHKEVRTVPIGDTTFETTTNTEYEWQWIVTDLDEKGMATLEMKLTALRLNTTGKDFEFQYDSAKANNPDDEYKKRLINYYDQLRLAKYHLRLEPRGRLVEVRGFDRLLSEVDVSGGIADFHALNLHDASFAWYLQQCLGVLPEKAIEKGKSWQEKVETRLKDIGELRGQLEFTPGDELKVGDHRCRQLRFTGEEKLDLRMKWGNGELSGPLKIHKIEGQTCFDSEAGIVRRGQAKIDMKGEVKTSDNENAPPLTVLFTHQLELEAK